MSRQRMLLSALTVLLLSAVLFASGWLGSRGRVTARKPLTLTVRSPMDAVRVWEQEGVRGRILLLFDAYPHGVIFPNRSADGSAATGPVARAVFQNLVRRVYLVAPEAEWEDFERRSAMFLPIRRLPRPRRGMYLLTFSGVPLVALPPSELPHLRETALVLVNEERFDPRSVSELLPRRGISADVFLTLVGDAAR